MTKTDPAVTLEPMPRSARAGFLRDLDWRRYVIYIGFVVVFAFFAILLGGQGFLSPNNLLNILSQTATIAVIAVGMTFVISAAEIDLSVGSVAGLSSVVAAIALSHWGLLAGIIGGLAVGLVVGAINGGLVATLGIPSFLVTLGMMGLVTGLAQRVTQLQAVPSVNELYNGLFGSGSLAGISMLIVWSGLAVLAGHYLYRHTRAGAHVLAVGDNVRAARVSGINTDRIKIGVLVASGLCAAIAGMLYTGRLHGATYTLGSADLLTVIAAVVVGGTRLTGGQGTIVGALIGSLILGMLNNGLILAGLSTPEQQIARGLIILIAVALTLREDKS